MPRIIDPFRACTALSMGLDGIVPALRYRFSELYGRW